MRKPFLRLFCILFISAFALTSKAQEIPTRLFNETGSSLEMRGGILFKPDESQLFQAKNNVIQRFDGNNWSLYGEIPISEEITAVGMHLGQIWLGTASGQLWKQLDNSFELFAPQEGQLKAGISKIISIQNQLWLATLGDGLFCWTNKRLFRFDEADGMPDLNVSDLFFHQGQLWAGTDQGLVSITFKDEKKRLKKVLTSDLLIGAICADSTTVWVGFQAGGIGKSLSESFISIGEDLGIVKMHFQYGRFWVLDEGGSLWTITNSSEKASLLPFVLNNKKLRISDFVFDQQGFLWLTTQLGVVASQVALRSYSFLADMQIQSLLEPNPGKMLLGTRNGLYHWEVAAHQYELVAGTNGLNILALYLDYKNRIWIGTYGQGMYCLESGKLTKIGPAHGLHNANVFSMAASKNGKTLFIGTLGGLYTVQLDATNPSKLVSAFKHHDRTGPGSYYIYQVFVDAKDRLWIGTDGMGAFMFHDNKFYQYKEGAGIDFRIVTSITEDQNGIIWLSSLDRGLFKITGKETVPVSIYPNQPKFEYAAIASHGNQLLLSTTEGIQKLNLDHLGAFSLNKVFGLQPTEGITNAILKHNNRLWFGMQEGIFCLDLAIFNFNQAPPLSIRLNDNESLEGTDSVFAHSKNALSFRLNSLWGGATEALYKRYKLIGLQDQWVGNARDEVFLQGLRPGKYQLIVQSSLYVDFSQANASIYSFTINKPFYAQWWFALLLLLITGLLAYVYTNSMARKRKNAEHAKIEQIRGQYELLKSQVSPHFLFNSFNTLLALIDEDQKLASAYVEKLSALFRSVLTYKDTDLITLKEELVLVEAYIYLQQQRFGDNLKVQIDISSPALKMMVMPMSLQLLVENAIKHNAISSQKPLLIEISVSNNQVIVKNNLQPKSQSEPSTGFGLSSLEQRYSTLFQEKLVIDAHKDYFQVHLPLISGL